MRPRSSAHAATHTARHAARQTIRRYRYYATLIVALSACTTPALHYSSLEELRESVTPQRSTLPAYDVTGGVWVTGQPLLINQEFDFSIGLGLPDIGPAIAAGARKKGNEETAQLFERMAPVALTDLVTQAMGKGPAKTVAGQVTVYGILFGQPQAQLRAILEIHDPDTEPSADPLRFVYVSEWRPIQGNASWSINRGETVGGFFSEAVPMLITMWNAHPLPHSASEPVNVTVTGGIAPQRLTGWVLQENNQRVILESQDIPKTFFSYPASTIDMQPAFTK
jgi:hypothetical protein